LKVAASVSSEVASPLMISTSFITGTGFIKCIPITFSGLERVNKVRCNVHEET